MSLPTIPASLPNFIPYLASQPTISTALKPYKVYESKLRELYAQDPKSILIANPSVNTVPLFAGHEHELKIRARDINSESHDHSEKYLLPLSDQERKRNGSPAIVSSMKEFKTNFNLFSESSLVDLDWSNIVAAGSSVVTALLPVSAPHNESKRALRAYYHEKLAPASDVDLFMYGLDEGQAIDKIEQIERAVRDSILSETTTIRTKNAITIASEYPTRHVQIVLRLYQNISEILTGFDVDCSCVAYDGKQVYAAPRAIAAFTTQINTIDLSRRSPSYENRLSKYSHRGFEVHWPDIDRSRVDPTIFERSFSRVMGLARLLVLEKLPHPNDRDTYLAKRRTERGRPELPWNARYRHQLPGNVKDAQPDDVAEWVCEDDVSNYHTFTVPYGPKYNAKKIEKLLFTKDLLLNAEWNRPKDRETILHRHPAFFGSVQDVIHDCCGFCPDARTDEDFAAQEVEEKIYIRGDVKFLTDNPGRQSIGSFNPITDDDWTEMAYVGNTERLCQAIVDGDLEHVQDWLSNPEADANRRDHTGRTPLQLATLCSTPEIVQCLIDHGARIVSRVVDGMTALHIASHRGNTQMVKALLEKSEANGEEEVRKEEIKKAIRRVARADGDTQMTDCVESMKSDAEDVDQTIEDDDGDSDSDSMTEGSFVKVKSSSEDDAVLAEDDKEEPDVYDIDVLSWDSPVSPLHLAIMGGHIETIELLIDTFGADVLLPVKLLYGNKNPKAAILTITLALQLPLQKANRTVETLLSKGASSTQADMNSVSALHYVVNEGKTTFLRTLADCDGPAALKAVNHIIVSGWKHNLQVDAPLLSALRNRNLEMVNELLDMGAKPEIDFETFAQVYHRKFENNTTDPIEMQKIFEKGVEQPIILAAKNELPSVVEKLLDLGVHPDTMPRGAYQRKEHPDRTYDGEDRSLLDIVQDKLKAMKQYTEKPKERRALSPPPELKDDEFYLRGLQRGTYKHWLALNDLKQARGISLLQKKQYEKEVKEFKAWCEDEDEAEKVKAVNILASEYTKVLGILQKRSAKTFYEVFPQIKRPELEKSRHYNIGRNANTEAYSTTHKYLIPDLTPAKSAQYDMLYEAAWTGDTEIVKKLTLGQEGRPLQVAVLDQRGFCPFSVAVLRGHESLARLLLEISTLQYQPDDKEKRFRYMLQCGEDDSDTSSNDDGLNVTSEIVNEDFTVEDIAALADVVKSRVSPMTMLCWQSEIWRAMDNFEETAAKHIFMPPRQDLYVHIGDESKQSWAWLNAMLDKESQRNRWPLIRYAIAKNDVKLLRFLLQLGADLAIRAKDEASSKVFSISSTDFDFAIRLGRTEMIGEIIKLTGAGIPLERLVKSSGVEVQEKPKYYQGLSVYGIKRKDWATAAAGRGASRVSIEQEHAPLLNVVFQGNLDTVEYFLSGTTPLRRYQEFAIAHRNDKRIITLSQAQGGIDKTLVTWLGTRADLAIHIAVMCKPDKDSGGRSNAMLEYLIRTMPEAIDAKSATGTTSLQLAFDLRRHFAARRLIAAGANQATRNNKGENLMHTIISRMWIRHDSDNDEDVLQLRSLIAMLDGSLVKTMLLERCGGTDPGSLTPLAMLLRDRGRNSEKVMDVLLEHSGGHDLEILNGAGDCPLHFLVRSNANRLIRYIVNRNPSLLYRENATGMTPLDVANTSYLRWRMENPPQIVSNHQHYYYYGRHGDENRNGIVSKSASDFAKKDADEDDQYRPNNHYTTWKLCNNLATARPSKRTLISLFDANEIAKRLANMQHQRNEENRRRERLGMSSRGFRGRNYNGNDEYNENLNDNSRKDEVSEWFGKADGFRKWDLEMWEREVRTDAGEKDESEVLISQESEDEV